MPAESSAVRLQGVRGLHGVGVSVVNALSEWLEVEVWTGGRKYLQRYDRGKPTGDLEETGKARRTGTRVTFLPDSEIFEERTFSLDTLSNRLREMAFLNRGLRITLTDERADKSAEFYYTGGIKQFVELLNENKATLHPRRSTSRRSEMTPTWSWPFSTMTAMPRPCSPSPTTSTHRTAAPTSLVSALR